MAGTEIKAGTEIRAGNTRAALVTGLDTELGSAVARRLTASGTSVVGQHRPGSGPGHREGLTGLVTADPGDQSSVAAAVEEAVALLGRLDILAVCHPRPHRAGLFKITPGEFWTEVDDALTGSFFFAQAAAPHLARGDGGRIVLTASMWHSGGAGLAAVASAAGGIVALTKTLTRDLGPLGVGVNAVVPGLVEGPWLACDAAGLGVDTDTLRRDPGRFVPTGRLGTADQVAATVAVLADPSLKAAVGQCVNVNGGHVRTRT